MKKAGTFAIASTHVFKRRAFESGAERKRCGDSESDCELSEGAQRQSIVRPIEIDIERGDVEHDRGQRQDAGDGGQALTTCRGAVARRIDQRRLERRRLQHRPTRSDDGDDRLVGMCTGETPEGSTEHMGAEPLGPRVHGRVCWCPSRVRRRGCIAQALVGLDVLRRERGDHRQAVVLVRQDVGRQQPEAALADLAKDQRYRQLPLLSDQLITVMDQQHHRPVDARSQQHQRNPTQSRGHRRVEGSPFNNAA